MILVVEPIFPNAHHAPGNAGKLRAIVMAAGTEPVAFAAHPAHRDAVYSIIGRPPQPGFQDIDIDVPPPGGIRLSRFLFQARTILGLARKLNARIVVCLGTTPETLFACRLLAMASPRCRIVAVLHGNLHKATGWRSRDPRRRWFDDTSALAAAHHRRIRFVVLENSIRTAAIAKGLVTDANCDTWTHPINDNEVGPPAPPPDPRQVHIAFVGGAKRDKGFGDFLAIARQLSSRDSRYKFSLVGGLQERFPTDDLQYVDTPDGFLDRADFIERLHHVDYVCLPLKEDGYTLTASGALIDAIAALKPLIALVTPSTADLFRPGPVGFLCESVQAMIDTMADIERLTDPVLYASFQDNLSSERDRRLVPALSQSVARTFTTLLNGE